MPKDRALTKEMHALDEHAISFITSSDFVVISTFDNEGKINTSPRGGETGFVNILNNSTLIIPDARGNNRIDSLLNIIETGKVGCLFFVPNLNETLRVNGTAKISVDEHHLALDFGLSSTPKSVIEVTITQMFLHCSMSLKRSKQKRDKLRVNKR